jgi:2-dehydro-3-deoxyphosphogluconate aldolase/(4S)-4-hydroxy-2-oxoglutarate aldolase
MGLRQQTGLGIRIFSKKNNMAKYDRLQVLTSMLKIGLEPLFYHDDPEIAAKIIKACLDGGARCIEFTNRGDNAHLVFTNLVERFKDDPRLILGGGTILDPATAALFLQLGANFIVGPNFNPEVARLCNRRLVPYTPGCATTTEISNAQELGVEICKIFPGEEVGGPAFVQAVRGPLPWSRLMPTGGVTTEKENVSAWIKAGAACLGIGSKLISAKVVAASDYTSITNTIRQILEWIQEARAEKPAL